MYPPSQQDSALVRAQPHPANGNPVKISYRRMEAGDITPEKRPDRMRNATPVCDMLGTHIKKHIWTAGMESAKGILNTYMS